MITAFIFGFLFFIFLDSLWIYTFAKNLYLLNAFEILRMDALQQHLEVNPAPAFLFYVIYFPVLFYLAVLSDVNVKEATTRGGLVGLASYGTYALTNHAIMKQWSWALTIADISWGIFLSGSVAFLVKKLLESRQ